MKISIFCTPLNCPFLIVRSACWADRDQQTRRDLPPAAHHLSIQIKSRLWLTFTNTPIFRFVLRFLLKNKCKKFVSNQFLTVFKPVDQLLSILSLTKLNIVFDWVHLKEYISFEKGEGKAPPIVSIWKHILNSRAPVDSTGNYSTLGL